MTTSPINVADIVGRELDGRAEWSSGSLPRLAVLRDCHCLSALGRASATCQTVPFGLDNCANLIRFRSSRMLCQPSPHARSAIRAQGSGSTVEGNVRMGARWCPVIDGMQLRATHEQARGGVHASPPLLPEGKGRDAQRVVIAVRDVPAIRSGERQDVGLNSDSQRVRWHCCRHRISGSLIGCVGRPPPTLFGPPPPQAPPVRLPGAPPARGTGCRTRNPDPASRTA